MPSDGNGFAKNAIIFGPDMSSSVHTDREKKIFVKVQSKVKMICRIKYSIPFTEQQKKFCLIFHCDGVNIYIFVNDVELYKFKAKNSEKMQLHYLKEMLQRIIS